MNNQQKIVISCLTVTSLGFIILLPFLGKDNKFKKKNSSEDNKSIKGLKTANKSSVFLIVFIIIGIIIVFLIFFWITRRIQKPKKPDIQEEKVALEKYLKQKCFFRYNVSKQQIEIAIGDVLNPTLISAIIFNLDITNIMKKIKLSSIFQKMYQELAKPLKELKSFCQLVVNFFQNIDGYLLQAFYNDQGDPTSSDGDLVNLALCRFNKSILQKEYLKKDAIQIAILSQLKGIQDTTELEKKYLNDGNYLSFFKTVIKNRTIRYQKDYYLFLHYYYLYDATTAFYLRLNNFFSKEKNKEYAETYREKIDKCMQEIDNFLKVEEIKH